MHRSGSARSAPAPSVGVVGIATYTLIRRQLVRLSDVLQGGVSLEGQNIRRHRRGRLCVALGACQAASTICGRLPRLGKSEISRKTYTGQQLIKTDFLTSHARAGIYFPCFVECGGGRRLLKKFRFFRVGGVPHFSEIFRQKEISGGTIRIKAAVRLCTALCLG